MLLSSSADAARDKNAPQVLGGLERRGEGKGKAVRIIAISGKGGGEGGGFVCPPGGGAIAAVKYGGKGA